MSKNWARMILFTGTLWISGCSPKIFVIDRHTILEEEAAGEWPQFEKDLLENASQPGPMPFQKIKVNKSDERLFNVLNGETTK